MAQKVTVVLLDDIDQTEAAETVSFGLDGANYEIDLNAINAAALRDALAVFVAHGRKVGSAGKARRAGRTSVTNLGPSAREVRDWARTMGYEVTERGRVPAHIREAFDAAH
ncbi:MAG: Lsr2 family protein [Nocardioides sp.]